MSHRFSSSTLLCLVMLSAADGSTAAEMIERKVIHSQPSVVLSSSEVSLAITERGGHMAPVTFFPKSDRPVQPYHISPWQDEKLTFDVPVLGPLRGDFFCLPFGGNSDEVNGEKHPPHGEVAGGEWTLVGKPITSEGITSMELNLQPKVRPGKVTKRVALIDGQSVVYTQHLIEGMSGRMPLGHHATLAMPEKEGAIRMAHSPIRFGLTNPGVFSDPTKREYQSLAIGAKFTDLRHVPTLWKTPAETDCSAFPTRRGYADLLSLFSVPSTELKGAPAWVTATNAEAGYVWFAFKDPEVLPTTVFWIENHGRHGSPWNGRNNCLGVEDVCAFFAEGLAPSTKPNVVSDAGIPTSIELSKSKPTAINYIQGVARIPAGFEQVKTVEFSAGQATFVSTTGPKVTISVTHEFLRSGKL